MSGKPKFYTKNGWQGDKYDPDLSTTDIAKLIKNEIKTQFPDVKVSVRTFYRGGGKNECRFTCPLQKSIVKQGRRIYVEIKECRFNPINPDWDPSKISLFSSKYTQEGHALLEAIRKIGNQYNYSDCDGTMDHFDTHFYLFIDYDYDSEQAWMKELFERGT